MAISRLLYRRDHPPILLISSTRRSNTLDDVSFDPGASLKSGEWANQLTVDFKAAARGKVNDCHSHGSDGDVPPPEVDQARYSQDHSDDGGHEQLPWVRPLP